MSNVNTERNNELHELSFQMMVIESQKLQAENSRYFRESQNKNKGYIDQNEVNNYYLRLLKLDAEGYALSLQFNDKLHALGYDHNAISIGPDAANISATNLLNKYGLEYPISWYIEEETREGLIFGYYKSQIIDGQYQEYVRKVSQLKKENKINEYEERRLVLAGEYFASHHKLLSNYHNHEQMNKEDMITNIGKSK